MRRFTAGERLGLAIILPVFIVAPLDMLRRAMFGDGSRTIGILMASAVVMVALHWAVTAEGPDEPPRGDQEKKRGDGDQLPATGHERR